MSDIKVRVGQSDAIKVLSTTTFSGVVTFSNYAEDASSAGVSTNVIGGIASVTQLNVSGITTLAGSGGITTTGGDLYVGGDLYIEDDLTFDEFTARNGNVTGILTAGLIDGGSF